MGHTRLGAVPKTRKWNELVEQVAGVNLAGEIGDSSADVDSIAAATLTAAQRSLEKAAHNPGVLYSFFLLTQVALASRTSNWQAALGTHGIHLSDDSTVFDFTAEVQDAIDRHLAQNPSGATDLSEIAQQSAGEAIASLAGTRTPSLFGGSSADVQNAVRSLSTKKGFGELGQRFFGRFIGRFLNFYLSRVTAASLGSTRLSQLGDVARFNDALKIHCEQSARIVRDFCGEWYRRLSISTELILRTHPDSGSRPQKAEK